MKGSEPRTKETAKGKTASFVRGSDSRRSSYTYCVGGSEECAKSDPRLFARAVLRGVSPEQLFDRLVIATGPREEIVRLPFRGFGDGTAMYSGRC